PNKNLETPHHHIERLRHDDPRLDDTGSSPDLIQTADTEGIWVPERKRETTPRAEALVKSVTPSQPAPKVASPAATSSSANGATGLFARIITWFKGSGANGAAPAVTETESSSQRKTSRPSGKASHA